MLAELLYESATEAFVSLCCAKQAQQIATASNTTGSTARANHGENMDSLLCSKHRDLKKRTITLPLKQKKEYRLHVWQV